MTAPRPLAVDVFALARDRGELVGEFPLAQLERLATSLLSTEGALTYAIDGAVDDRGRPGATMRLRAALLLQCQRCNGPLEYTLRREAAFRFVASDAELEALPVEDEEPDIIVGSRTLAVEPWVEDEAILSLPLVPRHEVCSVSVALGAQDRAGEEAPEAARPNPFAALAALKRGPPKG